MATIPQTPYRAQLVDSSGLPVAWIPFAEGTYEEEANQPSRMTIMIPVDLLAPSTSQQVLIFDPATEAYVSAFDASLLAPPYRIHLYDETPILIREFRIIRKSKAMSGGEHFVKVECEDLLGQLAQEIVTSYETSTLVGIKNPNFANSSKWTRGTGWTIASGVATCAASSGVLSQGNAIPDLNHDTDYTIVYTISGYSAGTMTVSVGGVSGTARSANGTYEETITVPASSTTQTVAFTPNAAGVMSIDNIGVIMVAEDVEAILTAIFDAQVFSPAVNFDPANTDADILDAIRGAKIENASILSVLNSLRESGLVGYFYVALVGGVREFYWVSELESNTGKVIRLGHNMLGVEEITEYDKLATIVYPKGIGEGDGALTLPNFYTIPDYYWPFNGNSTDLIGDGTYDLTEPNIGVQWIVDGAKIHGAAGLTAAATLPQYFRIAAALRGPVVEFSMMGWVKFKTLPSNGNQMTIVCESHSTDADTYYAIEIDTAGGNTRFQFAIVGDDGAASAGFPKRGTTNLAVDTWYHFAFYDAGAATGVRLYVNGTAQFAEAPFSVSGYTTDQFQIGASRRASTVAKKLDGYVDDFRAYNQALTGGEIALDYNAGVVKNGYILDQAAITSYGSRPAKFTDKSITHPDTLFKAAKAFLDRYSAPFVSYTAQATDLAQTYLELDRLDYVGATLFPNDGFDTDITGFTATVPVGDGAAVWDAGEMKLSAGTGQIFKIFNDAAFVAGREYVLDISVRTGSGISGQMSNLIVAMFNGDPRVLDLRFDSSLTAETKIYSFRRICPLDGYGFFIYYEETGGSTTSIWVDLLAIREVEANTFSADTMHLGSQVRVINEILGLSTLQTLIRRTINLNNPLDIQIELANRSSRLSDQFDEVFDLTSLLNSAAVNQIGAGQVVIQGGFSVIDWTDGSSTTINGGNITTGTITADKIFVDELEALTARTGSLVIADSSDTIVTGPVNAAIRTGSATNAAPSGGAGSGDGFIIMKSGAFRFGEGTTGGAYVYYDGGTSLDMRGVSMTVANITASDINAQSITSETLYVGRVPISTNLDDDGKEVYGVANSYEDVYADPGNPYNVNVTAPGIYSAVYTTTVTKPAPIRLRAFINGVVNGGGLPAINLLWNGVFQGVATYPWANPFFDATIAVGTHTFQVLFFISGVIGAGSAVQFSWDVRGKQASNLVTT